MPGLRGVGKTTIIYQLFSYLLNEKQIPKNRILYLNLENLKDVPNFNIKEYIDVFLKDVNEAYPTVKNKVFIFVDETQYSKNWASLGKIIFDEDKNVFMIFTGSDALNLEYNNDSARRSLKKEIYPLNFAEYLYLKYDIKIQYDGNSHYKNTSAVHHAVILKIEKTRSLDEILQSGEYKKKDW